MYQGRIALESMRLLPPPIREQVLVAFCEGLVAADRFYLRKYPRTPSIYASGVRYLFVGSLFQDVPTMLLARTGECEGFTAWRVAELRNAGELGARPMVLEFQETKPGIGLVHEYHVLVRRQNGAIEDPSRRLGMP